MDKTIYIADLTKCLMMCLNFCSYHNHFCELRDVNSHSSNYPSGEFLFSVSNLLEIIIKSDVMRVYMCVCMYVRVYTKMDIEH